MAVLAPTLARLRNETNTAWPSRDHSSDGWIGDPNHQASGRPENGGSDHNPNRRNIVDATDTDVDGIDPALFVARAIKHPATNYVIYNRRIWSRSRGFAAHKYTGSNPHDKHIHVSIIQDPRAENSTTGWGLTTAGDAPAPVWPAALISALPRLDRSDDVRGSVHKLQTLLVAEGIQVETDGVFGPSTAAAVKTFQNTKGLTVDGVVGPKTWTALLGPLPTLRAGATSATSAAGRLATRKAQLLLNLGGATLVTDGVFGRNTTAAVRAFQEHHGLTVDGVLGPKTWTALIAR